MMQGEGAVCLRARGEMPLEFFLATEGAVVLQGFVLCLGSA